MDRALIKQSIDEWQDFYLRARSSLIPRPQKRFEPTFDLGVALTGVRRSGKTHIAFQMSMLRDVAEVFYYNFEDPLFLEDNSVKNLDLLLSVAQEYRGEKITHLILDEIQLVEGWERWLRKLIDQKRYKIIVTGSSAKLLSSEIATSLTGRVIEEKVWPLSFKETIAFKNITLSTQDDHLSLLREIMLWGSFPEVVKLNIEQRKTVLRQYLSDIVNKDVVSRNQVRNKRALDQILTYYLTNLSSLHSYSALSKAFALDTVTASEYTKMLADAFLLSEVYRYHNNLKVQARDARKVYIVDTGFRTVGARSVNDDTGKLLENLVYTELLRRQCEVYYYKEEQEVDFIIVEKYQPVAAIQVCSSDLRESTTWTREITATVKAVKSLGLDLGQIVSFNREEKLQVDGIKIEIVPAYRWLSEQ